MELRIRQIKDQLQKIGDMRPGSINTQLTVCGKPNCACKDPKKPKKHGPYYQLSYVHNAKSTTQFIKKEFLETVEQQLGNFKLFKSLTAEWIDLALSVSRAKLEIDKLRLKEKKA